MLNQDGRRRPLSRPMQLDYDGGVPDQVHHSRNIRNSHCGLYHKVARPADPFCYGCRVCLQINFLRSFGINGMLPQK